MFSLLRAAALAVAFVELTCAAATANKLPVVDLGYELQRATVYNSTGGYYNFSNIRYAAPPTGNLRFTAPKQPKKNRGTVQTGQEGRICPQAAPAWEIIAGQFIPEYLQGQTVFNGSSFNTSTGSPAPLDPRTTEDCLFLDVFAPKNIFDNAGKGKGAPVLVWIYGGGYTMGDKSGSGNPAGLLKRSGGTKGAKVIYVAMNYRLGALGWLSGPTFQANGTANAGLHDQRFALKWIQEHIHKFGGDPDRVTVFGESAGGGSIMHQITAYGRHDGPTPFQQAILQSPGFLPYVSNQQQEQTLKSFLSLLGVDTIEEARQQPFSAILQANAQQIGASPYGQYTYGPTVDGDFVPALPGLLLLHGQYPKDLNIMVGHNADEVSIVQHQVVVDSRSSLARKLLVQRLIQLQGLLFTSPFVQNNTAFRQDIIRSLPTVRAYPNVVNYITNTLYPPIFDGSQDMGYTDQIGRAAALASEL